MCQSKERKQGNTSWDTGWGWGWYLKTKVGGRLFHWQSSAKVIAKRLVTIQSTLQAHFDFPGHPSFPGVASKPVLQTAIPPARLADFRLETCASLWRPVAKQQAPHPWWCRLRRPRPPTAVARTPSPAGALQVHPASGNASLLPSRTLF